jgi:hypothetical protein
MMMKDLEFRMSQSRFIMDYRKFELVSELLDYPFGGLDEPAITMQMKNPGEASFILKSKEDCLAVFEFRGEDRSLSWTNLNFTILLEIGKEMENPLCVRGKSNFYAKIDSSESSYRLVKLDNAEFELLENMGFLHLYSINGLANLFDDRRIEVLHIKMHTSRDSELAGGLTIASILFKAKGYEDPLVCEARFSSRSKQSHDKITFYERMDSNLYKLERIVEC